MTQTPPLYAGETLLKFSPTSAGGHFITLDGEDFYAIRSVQQMPVFFMSIVSASDHWMFISSNGALTAGRKNPELALFPYYTVDKIHDSAEITGAKTIIRANKRDKTYLWEPFSDCLSGLYAADRNLYKNVVGNRLIFEEINHDLEIRFAYEWTTSEKFGFVRKAVLSNLSREPLAVELLDGIQNLLPHGVNRMMQADKSCLVDAYKKSELVKETGLGVYRLNSIPVDRAEPSESLKANTVWSNGPAIRRRLVSSTQLAAFRRGCPVVEETDVRGKRGAYFVNLETTLPAEGQQAWHMVAEVNQTASRVAALNQKLASDDGIAGEIESDISEGTRNLRKIVASADGLQLTEDRLSTARHFANVLFNVMRGGIFDSGYEISRKDLDEFVRKANSHVHSRHADWLATLPDPVRYTELLSRAEATGDPALLRACLEYMPLTFARRHGDPSRPWNLFAIETRAEDGTRILNYQGNWRDIFQNWEALALSFPDYIEGMISKFVNASTADGYNPYRITRDGFEWEIHNPNDPWSFIGYWGDHQIIYLLKLLGISERHHPGRLQELLVKQIFSYANIPYRIKDYRSVLQDPHHSIDYDENLERLIQKRIQERGTDGKVIQARNGEIYLVNLAEKLLVSMLAKLSNFAPEGGIWMNTQRPEWNDANNALTGYGLSMVTLYYLRRYIEFCRRLFTNSDLTQITVSAEVAEMLDTVKPVLDSNRGVLAKGFDAKTRKQVLDTLGEAGAAYRNRICENGFSGEQVPVTVAYLADFFSLTLEYMDQSIRVNRRPDGLYHSYNLLTVQGEDGIEVSHFYEMLEGQVAVISSGYLSAAESIDVLDALRHSAMFREDQYSYILYPDRPVPAFTEKNNIPREAIETSELLRQLLNDGNTAIIEQDVNGVCHFNGAFRNKDVLLDALERLDKPRYDKLVAKDRQFILDLYEELFQHRFFTGRSGSFFSYEGLGSIYWHMVSKLLLAVEEVFSEAVARGEAVQTIGKLRKIYFDVRRGLGTDKSPAEYGAFPTDPYSHTPGHSGAQQPGMTGQVKEDIIVRWRELGLVVAEGRMQFEGSLVRDEEMLAENASFSYIDIDGAERTIPLTAGTLAYTYCQIPIVLKRSRTPCLRITKTSGTTELQGTVMTPEDSRAVFERSGEIVMIEAEI
ncbi:MAG: hypothetical protein EHM23_15225 [Acidobacteria bacterium]|nr:MAG: hypothetical protein EHM23_15225 [Acidobacteriota bacterium]